MTESTRVIVHEVLHAVAGAVVLAVGGYVLTVLMFCM